MPPGRLDGIQRVGLAGPAAGLTVGAVDPGHLHPSRPQMAAQSRAVGAGALHADAGDRPEPGQPGQQPAVPGRCGGELRDRQQPADLIQRGRHVHVQMGVHAAGHRARSIYDGHESSLPLARCQGMAPAAQQRGGGVIALLAQGDPPH
jgi:hypothetical protein